LLSQLFQCIQDANPVLRLRGLLVLHHVIQALRSRTLASGKRQFQDAAPEVFRFVVHLWNSGAGKLFDAVNAVRGNPTLKNQLEGLKVDGEQAKLALKVLHGLLINAHPPPPIETCQFLLMDFRILRDLSIGQMEMACFPFSAACSSSGMASLIFVHWFC